MNGSDPRKIVSPPDFRTATARIVGRENNVPIDGELAGFGGNLGESVLLPSAQPRTP